MKNAIKILILSLCLALSLSSCFIVDLFNGVKQETERVITFTTEFTVLIENPTVENAEELLHPSSPLTPEHVISKIEGNEKLQSLNTAGEISVGEITNLQLKYDDPTLGGTVYTANCEIIVDGTPITVKLTLLSTEGGFGLYDFDIE